MLQAYRGTAQASRSQRGPCQQVWGGTCVISLAARLYRSSAVHFSSLPPSCLQHGMWPQSPSLSRFLLGAPIPASLSFLAFPSVPVRVPVSAVWARKLGADRRRSPVSVLVFLCSLARPPVALTWAPQGALPAKQWRPGRRDPPSGRGRTPAVEQGAQAVRPQQALGGCGDSTQRIHQGSKWALFQYWLGDFCSSLLYLCCTFGASTLIHRFGYIHLSVI